MFSVKKLGWAGTSKHNFDLQVYSTRWPPFYSTYLFLPKIKINIRNTGNMLNKTSVSVDVRKYDGDISSVTTINDYWGDTGSEGELKVNSWKEGELKSYVAKIPGNRLPLAGTYIFRVKVTNWIPQDTPYKELIQELKKANIKEEDRKEFIKRGLEEKKKFGIKLHRLQPGNFKGEVVFEGRVVDYFRVEEFSSLLNFWLVVTTLLLVIATMLLAIATLIHH